MLAARAREVVGDAPCVVVINKADLAATWEVTRRDIEELKRRGWVVTTSAKTGVGVEQAFEQVADLILTSKPWSEKSSSLQSRD
jgi:Ni2+-binding GTPase involved in maturation of urease and hydrogenase